MHKLSRAKPGNPAGILYDVPVLLYWNGKINKIMSEVLLCNKGFAILVILKRNMTLNTDCRRKVLLM